MKPTLLSKASRAALTVAVAAGLMATGLIVNHSFSGKAEAQVTIPVILVINRAQLLNDSEAGKTVSTQAETLRETIQGELQKSFDELQSEQEQLIAQQSVLAPEVLQDRAQKLDVKRQQFQLDQQVKNREFQASVAKATSEIGKVLEPILADLIRERSATMLIDRSELLFATPDIDVTAEAMKRLNEKLTEVKLERVKVDPKTLQQAAEEPVAAE